MGESSHWKDSNRTRVVANAFNKGLDRLASKSGLKPKLFNMQESQSGLIDELGVAYDSSSLRSGREGKNKRISVGQRNSLLRLGEVSAKNEYLRSYDDRLPHFLSDHGVREEFLKRIARVSRSDGEGFGVVVMDIKNFKYLNDALGHNKGDEILDAISVLVRKNSRLVDSFWRIGGDELAVIMDADSQKQIEELIFEHRHKSDHKGETLSWLASVNSSIKSMLNVLVTSTKLAGTDLGDLGELRAGIFYVDKKTIKGFKVGDDLIGELIKGAKGQLEIVKEKHKSRFMIWGKDN